LIRHGSQTIYLLLLLNNATSQDHVKYHTCSADLHFFGTIECLSYIVSLLTISTMRQILVIWWNTEAEIALLGNLLQIFGLFYFYSIKQLDLFYKLQMFPTIQQSNKAFYFLWKTWLTKINTKSDTQCSKMQFVNGNWVQMWDLQIYLRYKMLWMNLWTRWTVHHKI